jgi:hypothetical protein
VPVSVPSYPSSSLASHSNATVHDLASRVIVEPQFGTAMNMGSISQGSDLGLDHVSDVLQEESFGHNSESQFSGTTTKISDTTDDCNVDEETSLDEGFKDAPKPRPHKKSNQKEHAVLG